MHYSHFAAIASLALLSACAPNTTPVTKKGYQGKPPVGTAIVLTDYPLLTVGGATSNWRWIPFDGTSAAGEVAYCGNGSTTGLAIDRLDKAAGGTDDLLVFFDGGGACWSWATCNPLQATAVDRGYDEAKFLVEARDFIPSSITNRALLPAALAGATIVFVPYCTGDVHGGDSVRTYSYLVDSVTWRHKGHANVMAYLKRLAATFPSPRKLVVAGSSAGGFGALVNYEAFRWYWPDAQGYLIDDSGPALVNNDVPANLRDAWFNAWSLGVATDPFCLGCRTNLASAFTELSDMHPGDRLAFVSHTQDKVMGPFMLSTGTQFEAALRQLEQDVLRPTPNVRAFYELFDDHMMLTPLTTPTPVDFDYTGSHVVGTTSLAAWLDQMISDDPAWDTLMTPP